MTERPINFNDEMVRAILDNRKTVTRRPAPIEKLDIMHYPDGGIAWGVRFTKPIHGSLGSYSGGNFTEREALSIIASQFCPFGVPGDRLWVRETWQVNGCLNCGHHHYRATEPDYVSIMSDGWRSPVTLPRWASRITLEVTAVRVERTLDITEAGAKAEGFESIAAFLDCWDSIYAAKGLGRGANPWVWVVEFKRVEGKK